ncbi:MAG TPA: DoxX family protein [Tepidisphaeraceae bacterium]|nr:DoxX family protein [Tepidisphaeraceae bacterium]
MAVETIRRDGRDPVVPAITSRYPTPAASIGLLIARIPLGVYFIAAGVAKFGYESKTGYKGVAGFAVDNAENAQRFMSSQLSWTYLYGLPWAEIVLGGMLIVGFLGRVVSFLLAALLVSIMIAKLPALTALATEKNLIFAGLALGLAFTGVGLLSVDGLLFGPRRRVRVTEEYVEPLGG